MTITRKQVELTLIRRTKKRMGYVEMDTTTYDGTNRDLSDPIATALQQMGYAVADITNPVDADLASVEDIAQFLDLAELRLLESIRGNFDAVDLRFEDRDEKFSQFATALDKTIEAKQKAFTANYGSLGSTLEAGVVSLNFQQKHDD